MGRYIDTTRSDMYRLAGNVTLQDKLSVFKVDHFIFMWRIYNHIQEFETLRLAQVDNVSSCKLGKWLGEQTEPAIKSSRQFKEVFEAHSEIHKHAVAAWHAKEKEDMSAAMAAFNKCYDAYFRFDQKIIALQDYLKTLGYTEETEMIVYGK